MRRHALPRTNTPATHRCAAPGACTEWCHTAVRSLRGRPSGGGQGATVPRGSCGQGSAGTLWRSCSCVLITAHACCSVDKELACHLLTSITPAHLSRTSRMRGHTCWPVPLALCTVFLGDGHSVLSAGQPLWNWFPVMQPIAVHQASGQRSGCFCVLMSMLPVGQTSCSHHAC